MGKYFHIITSLLIIPLITFFFALSAGKCQTLGEKYDFSSYESFEDLDGDNYPKNIVNNPMIWPYGGTIDSSKINDVYTGSNKFFYDYKEHFNRSIKYGYLKFNKDAIFLKTSFTKPLFLYHTDFLGNAIFAKSIFNDRAEFIGSNFYSFTDFRKCEFNDGVFFNGSHFYDRTLFQGAQFNKRASFENINFHDRVNFSPWYTSFFENWDIKYTNFYGSVDFDRCNFMSDAGFNETRFHDRVFFDNTVFNKSANFRFSLFKKYTSFQFTDFKGMAYFAQTKFSSVVTFNSSKFNQGISFYKTTFSNEVNFTNSIFHDKLEIVKTNFSKGLDLRLANLDSAIIYIDHQTHFPLGELNAKWKQLKGKIFFHPKSCHNYEILDKLKDKKNRIESDIESATKYNIEIIDSLKHKLNTIEKEIYRLNPIYVREYYIQTEILYNRLRDNYLAQNDRSSADGVMYELASKRSAYLKEPLWGLYGLFMGWGYKPLRFVLTVFLLVILPFAVLWYKRFYHRVAPLVAKLSKEEKELLYSAPDLEPKRFLKFFSYKKYVHRDAFNIGSFFSRLWHVFYFSTSVLLSIRFKKEWIEREDKTFLTWVTIEWTLGIVLYALFIVLVKSYEFGYVKGLLGF